MNDTGVTTVNWKWEFGVILLENMSFSLENDEMFGGYFISIR